MPPEILLNVIDLAGRESLPALRLTNKYLCAVSNTPFATLHFSERRHVQSEYSMDALVEITAHPFFGKFVKTVILSGSRPEIRSNPFVKNVPRSCTPCTPTLSSSLCKHPAPHHIALRFERLAGKLQKAFSNIRHHSTLVSIGVCDSAHMCFGSAQYHADCATISKISSRSDIDFSKPIECNQFVKTYETIFSATVHSGCRIKGIKLFTSRVRYPDTPSHLTEVRDMMRHFVDYLHRKLSIEWSLQLSRSRTPRYYLKYDQDTSELDLSGLHFDLPAFGNVEVQTRRILALLVDRTMVQVKLRDCWFREPEVLRTLCSPTLERLTLHHVTLHTSEPGTNIWSSFLDLLSRTSRLKYLELHHCAYEFLDAENENADPNADHRWLELPSGLYQVSPEMDEDQLRFFLAPSGDREETIVLSDPTSIAVQLKTLADQVAQMEINKVAEIEREGWVRTDIIGVCKDPVSAEANMSGENEHRTVQNNQTGETSKNHDEQPENNHDDHDELATTH
jgi:hypothetical protein